MHGDYCLIKTDRWQVERELAFYAEPAAKAILWPAQ